MPLITSANIACGFHAGDPATRLAALVAAARHGVRARAHPSFPDRENFGRANWPARRQAIFEDCVYQVGALAGLARAAGLSLTHLKPHGALYNMACRDDAYARPVIAAAELFGLPLLGLPQSRLDALSAGRCRFVAEGFADRRYLPDGSLVPRSRPDAFVHDPAEAVAQVQLADPRARRPDPVRPRRQPAGAGVRARAAARPDGSKASSSGRLHDPARSRSRPVHAGRRSGPATLPQPGRAAWAAPPTAPR